MKRAHPKSPWATCARLSGRAGKGEAPEGRDVEKWVGVELFYGRIERVDIAILFSRILAECARICCEHDRRPTKYLDERVQLLFKHRQHAIVRPLIAALKPLIISYDCI